VVMSQRANMTQVTVMSATVMGTSTQFRRVAARRGGKRAQAAVAHSLLVAAWHILNTHESYHDLGGDYFLTRENPDHRRRRALRQLERLGYRVTIEPFAAA
jgi:transposase